jgi:uncharacterized protein (DUF486 family)
MEETHLYLETVYQLLVQAAVMEVGIMLQEEILAVLAAAADNIQVQVFQVQQVKEIQVVMPHL